MPRPSARIRSRRRRSVTWWATSVNGWRGPERGATARSPPN